MNAVLLFKLRLRVGIHEHLQDISESHNATFGIKHKLNKIGDAIVFHNEQWDPPRRESDSRGPGPGQTLRQFCAAVGLGSAASVMRPEAEMMVLRAHY